MVGKRGESMVSASCASGNWPALAIMKSAGSGALVLRQWLLRPREMRKQSKAEM